MNHYPSIVLLCCSETSKVQLGKTLDDGYVVQAVSADCMCPLFPRFSAVFDLPPFSGPALP